MASTAYPRPPVVGKVGEEDLVFQIIDWYIPEADRDWMANLSPEDPAPLYEIIMFGVTNAGNSVTVKVTGFEPYFFVRLPKKNWNAPVAAVRKLKDTLQTGRSKSLQWDKMARAWVPRSFASAIIPRRLEGHLSYAKCNYRKDFWGFTNDRKFPFAKIKVKSLALFRALKKYFDDQWLLGTGFQPYETNIDPFLRFIHERNIAPCGWVRLPADSFKVLSGGGGGGGSDGGAEDESNGSAFSRTQIVVEVESDNVHPVEINKIAPLLVASFDIECTSSHGDFPVAIKDYRKLAQDLVGAVVMEGGVGPDSLKEWLHAAFKSDAKLVALRTPKGAEISRVFLKNKLVGGDAVKLAAAIEEVVPKLVRVLAKAEAFSQAWAKEDGEDEDGDGDEGAARGVRGAGGGGGGTLTQQRTRLENDVLALLGFATDTGEIRKDGAFRDFPLKGDAIIQIGTTVHRYGSDEIIFKHMVALDTCDNIDGCVVESYSSEASMLLGWKEMFAELDPDILIGYNIFGFDMDYMWKRAKELNIAGQFGEGLGRLTARNIRNIKEQKLSSSALGDNYLKYFPLDGIVNVDLLKVMQRDQKLDSYKLDSVAAHFLGDHKNDLTPNEIFAKFGGTSADRAEIGRYCLQDCALVNRLLHKLKVLENNVGMGNVCSVPLSYLFMRGQGIKIFSLVSKECRAKQMVIPVIHKPRPFGIEMDEDTMDMVGYEGAIVLDPQEGMYLDTPITVLDYASLYPTSMIERNLSHDCFVVDETYKEEAEAAGTKFITVTYDIFEGVGDKKHKTGVQNCTFAQPKPDADGKERRGTIPEILIKLINQRKNTRKKIEYETVEVRGGVRYAGLAKRMDNGDIKLLDVDLGATKHIDAADIVSVVPTYSSFEQAVLDALQLAFKVTANSLYGQIGARTSQIYWKDIAACTTATGRERIMMAKDFVEKEYGAEVIYGDSVASYTPVYVRVNGNMDICTIEELANRYGKGKWIRCVERGRQSKEACELQGVETWTEKGWTPLQRVIRHKLAKHKQMIRILTHTGIVDATDDHSLVGRTGECLTPKTVTIGTELLHHPLPMPDTIKNIYTKEQAQVMGFFFGDGSCGVYNCPSGEKSSWALNNAGEDIVDTYLELCDDAYPGLDWVVMPTLESSGVYKISPRSTSYGSIKAFVTKYRELMYYQKAKVIPHGILHGSVEVREAFWKGLYDADGDKEIGYNRIDQKNHISAAHITWLAESLGWKTSINTRADKPHIFRMTYTKNSQRKNPYAIKKMGVIPYDGFVYDLTTENHHFAAGVGKIICHNTDSIFIKFPTVDASGVRVTGKDALPIAIAAGQRAAREIKRILPAPQSLEYEKTLFPFILFSKKRYVGNLYEDDANKKPKQKSMGIVLKRRDNAQIVKIIYGGIIDLLMNGQPLEASVDFLKEQLQNLVEGRTPMDELIVTKTLRGHYKNPQQIAHKVLADRMGERDAGNKPAANDRVPYVYIVPPPGVEVRLQGDRIEHPDYIKEKRLTPDYRHYITNQIMKPVCQLFALCVEQLPGYSFPPSYWLEREAELQEHTTYRGNAKKIKDRLAAVRMRIAEELLFEPFVSQLANVMVGSKKGGGTRKMLTRVMGPPKAVPMPHGSVEGPIRIEVRVDMEKGKGYVLHVETKLGVGEGAVTWAEASFTKEYPRKKPYTKTYLTVVGAEKALEYISREKEEQARAHGIAWTIADKTCLRLWKKTLEIVHELDDKIRKAEEEGDISANEELQELTRFSRLSWAREVIGYTLG